MRAKSYLVALVLPMTAVSAEPRAVGAAPQVQVQAPSLALPANRSCLQPGVTLAKEVPVAKRTQRLGELPPANQYLAVVRQVGGCPEPAIVRSGIGR